VTTAIERARADLDAGRLWKARDRLTGLLIDDQDADVLDLLARVHFEMHNLPAAGALWFVTGRDDDAARDSIAAWRERQGNDEARWRSIPSPVRGIAHGPHLRELEGAASNVTGHTRRGPQGVPGTATALDRLVPAAFGGCLIWALAMIVIGTWSVVRWIAG
jgi:hypothetical protein